MRHYKYLSEDSRIIPLSLLDKRSKDLSGDNFGRLIALGVVHRDYVSCSVRGNFWLFRCSCGGEVIARISDVISGRTRSCGCLRREVTRDRMQTHGQGATKTYKTWLCMVQRCYNPKHKEFHNYAARGIDIVLRWYDRDNLEQSYLNFLEDMGERPFISAQIDRIDNDKGYSPENCRWVTPKQNSNNQRRTIYVTANGVSRSLSEWAGISGKSADRIMRAVRNGKDMNLFLLPGINS